MDMFKQTKGQFDDQVICEIAQFERLRIGLNWPCLITKIGCSKYNTYGEGKLYYLQTTIFSFIVAYMKTFAYHHQLTSLFLATNLHGKTM